MLAQLLLLLVAYMLLCCASLSSLRVATLIMVPRADVLHVSTAQGQGSCVDTVLTRLLHSYICNAVLSLPTKLDL